jgi:hypothetical protein
MRVYFAGAYNEGKTTLARKVSDRYNLSLLPEVARIVKEEWELPFPEIRKDVELVNKFQEEVFHRQFQAEKTMQTDFVSSRCIDNIVFLSKFGSSLSVLADTPVFKDYVTWLKTGIVFFVIPHKELMKDDGVRDTDYGQCVELSGAVRLTLELLGVKYIPIHPVTEKDRELLIFSILDLVKK